MTDLYDMLPATKEYNYFGHDPRDFGRRRPFDWFHHNRDRFLLPFDRIAAAKAPYSADAPPDSEGVYFIFTGDDLAYVGQSVLISDRLIQHAYPLFVAPPLSWITHFSAIWVPLLFLDAVEGYYIHLLRPLRNLQYRALRPHVAKYLSADRR